MPLLILISKYYSFNYICGCTKSMEIFLERGKKMKHFDGLYVQRAEKKHTRYIEIDE